MTKQTKKIVSLLTLIIFLSTQSVWALPLDGAVLGLNRETPGFLRIEIPKELASLEDIYEAPPSNDPRLILHIQDLHGNYQAQVQIKKLLDYLHDKYGFNLLFLEGGVGKLHPEFLNVFPDKERNLAFADYMAQDGELGGPELFLASGNKDVEAVGIEETTLYRKNFEALKVVLGEEDLTQAFMKRLEEKATTLGSRFFSKDLQRVLQEWTKFEKGHRDFLPYVRRLAEDAKKYLGLDLESLFAQVEWPQITRLLVIQSMEPELDLPNAEAEKTKLIEFLKEKKVSAALIHAIEELREQRIVMSRVDSEEERLQNLPRYLLERLVEEAGPKGFYFHDYPNFSLYAGYLILQNELDSKSLFQEIELVFSKLLEQLAVSEKEKNLLEVYRDLDLLGKLYRLELTRKDSSRALYRRNWISPEAISGRILGTEKEEAAPEKAGLHSLMGEPEKLTQLFNTAYDFYDYARQRESIFYDRIKEEMSKRSREKAILVTGGFHTDGLMDIFREQKINYGVLMPRIPGAIADSNYNEVMLENRPVLVEIATIVHSIFINELGNLSAVGSNLDQRLREALSKIQRVLGGALAPKSAKDLQAIVDFFNDSTFAKEYNIVLRAVPGAKIGDFMAGQAITNYIQFAYAQLRVAPVTTPPSSRDTKTVTAPIAASEVRSFKAVADFFSSHPAYQTPEDRESANLAMVRVLKQMAEAKLSQRKSRGDDAEVASAKLDGFSIALHEGSVTIDFSKVGEAGNPAYDLLAYEEELPGYTSLFKDENVDLPKEDADDLGVTLVRGLFNAMRSETRVDYAQAVKDIVSPLIDKARRSGLKGLEAVRSVRAILGTPNYVSILTSIEKNRASSQRPGHPSPKPTWIDDMINELLEAVIQEDTSRSETREASALERAKKIAGRLGLGLTTAEEDYLAELDSVDKVATFVTGKIESLIRSKTVEDQLRYAETLIDRFDVRGEKLVDYTRQIQAHRTPVVSTTRAPMISLVKLVERLFEDLENEQGPIRSETRNSVLDQTSVNGPRLISIKNDEAKIPQAVAFFDAFLRQQEAGKPVEDLTPGELSFKITVPTVTDLTIGAEVYFKIADERERLILTTNATAEDEKYNAYESDVPVLLEWSDLLGAITGVNIPINGESSDRYLRLEVLGSDNQPISPAFTILSTDGKSSLNPDVQFLRASVISNDELQSLSRSETRELDLVTKQSLLAKIDALSTLLTAAFATVERRSVEVKISDIRSDISQGAVNAALRWTRLLLSEINSNPAPVNGESREGREGFIQDLGKILSVLTSLTEVPRADYGSLGQVRPSVTVRSETRNELESLINRVLAPESIDDRVSAVSEILSNVFSDSQKRRLAVEIIEKKQETVGSSSLAFKVLLALKNLLSPKDHHFGTVQIASWAVHSRSLKRITDFLSLGVLKNVTIFGVDLVKDGKFTTSAAEIQAVKSRNIHAGDSYTEDNFGVVAGMIHNYIVQNAPRNTALSGAPTYLAQWSGDYLTFTVKLPPRNHDQVTSSDDKRSEVRATTTDVPGVGKVTIGPITPEVAKDLGAATIKRRPNVVPSGIDKAGAEFSESMARLGLGVLDLRQVDQHFKAGAVVTVALLVGGVVTETKATADGEALKQIAIIVAAQDVPAALQEVIERAKASASFLVSDTPAGAVFVTDQLPDDALITVIQPLLQGLQLGQHVGFVVVVAPDKVIETQNAANLILDQLKDTIDLKGNPLTERFFITISDSQPRSVKRQAEQLLNKLHGRLRQLNPNIGVGENLVLAGTGNDGASLIDNNNFSATTLLNQVPSQFRGASAVVTFFASQYDGEWVKLNEAVGTAVIVMSGNNLSINGSALGVIASLIARALGEQRVAVAA